MRQQLANAAAFDRVVTRAGAGTGDVNGTAVDMQGYQAVTFIAFLGAITATGVPSLRAQQGDQSDGSDATDLAGTKVTGDDQDSDKILVLEVTDPIDRYVRPVVGRDTANVVVDAVVAIRHRARKAPTSQGSDVAGIESHAGPSEGTA